MRRELQQQRLQSRAIAEVFTKHSLAEKMRREQQEMNTQRLGAVAKSSEVV